MNDVYQRLRLHGQATIAGKGESATARRLVRNGLAQYGESTMQIVVKPGITLPELDAGARPPQPARHRCTPLEALRPKPPEVHVEPDLDPAACECRLPDFHGQCGARIFTGYIPCEQRPLYFASDAPNAKPIDVCPACGEPLRIRTPILGGACEYFAGRTHVSSSVVTAFAMEQRYLAARERLCQGAPLDAETIVCMCAELKEGLALEELAPLYGRDAQTLRGEIAAFTNTTNTAHV